MAQITTTEEKREETGTWPLKLLHFYSVIAFKNLQEI